MTTESEFKPIAKDWLRQFGFEVTDIELQEGIKTPDFEVAGKHSKYTIELKIKGDDAEEVARDSEALSRGELVSRSTPLGSRNTLSGRIKEAVEQLIEHDPQGKTFRVVWLHCTGLDPGLHEKRFHSTLFGTETLWINELVYTVTCYYFHESAFYTWRNQLDAVILTLGEEGQLCINSLSPRVDKFRESELVHSMCNGLCDPKKLEASYREVMLADCDIDRKKPDEVIRCLQDKYGVSHLVAIPMGHHVGRISVAASRRRREGPI